MNQSGAATQEHAVEAEVGRQERRHFERWRPGPRCRTYWNGGSRRGSGVTVNLSDGGLCLADTIDADIGSAIELTIKFDGFTITRLAVLLRVDASPHPTSTLAFIDVIAPDLYSGQNVNLGECMCCSAVFVAAGCVDIPAHEELFCADCLDTANTNIEYTELGWGG
jgi:hypothetical protein